MGNEGNALQTPQNTGRGYAEPKDKIRNYLSDRGGKDRLNMGTCRLRTVIGMGTRAGRFESSRLHQTLIKQRGGWSGASRR
jgi:hypothetical protein